MKYAIISLEFGWLENVVVWDGNLQTWQPPSGTKAVPLDEINLSTLPQWPEND